MKTEDFKRLKAKLGDEFTAEYRVEKDKVMVLVTKKDEWEGVEFVELHSGGIYKILSSNPEYTFQINVNGNELTYPKNSFKPSTQQAYVEQLKKTAFDKFGEIKEGDRFIYIKEADILFHNELVIYKQGKWAERVKERVKVDFLNKKEFGHRLDLHFQLSDKLTLDYEGCQFLASQLEKYLNGEIE